MGNRDCVGPISCFLRASVSVPVRGTARNRAPESSEVKGRVSANSSCRMCGPNTGLSVDRQVIIISVNKMYVYSTS